jgi:hypothetical protein
MSKTKRKFVHCEEEKEKQPCVICLEEINTEDGCLLPCAHTFHSKCLWPWLIMNKSCPTCRNTNIGCQHCDSNSTDVIVESKSLAEYDTIIRNTMLHKKDVIETVMIAIAREMIVIKKQNQSDADSRIARQLHNQLRRNEVLHSVESRFINEIIFSLGDNNNNNNISIPGSIYNNADFDVFSDGVDGDMDE